MTPNRNEAITEAIDMLYTLAEFAEPAGLTEWEVNAVIEALERARDKEKATEPAEELF